MQSRFAESWLCGALVLGLTCVFPRSTVRADDPARPPLSPQVRRVLQWLPESTETVVAGQSFPIRVHDQAGVSELTPKEWVARFQAVMPETALGALNEPEMEKYLKPLEGNKVALALRGGRNYEWITTTLPTYRTEGCAVVVFEDDLGETGTEWVKTVRAGAQQIRQIAGRAVFVFPPTKAMRPARKSEWPGTMGIYLVLLNSRTILCATSDNYLEQLLERIVTEPDRRALPDDLPEWNHVDSTAPSWMLRHISKGGRRPIIQGVTWSMTVSKTEVFYVPVDGKEAAATEFARESWLHGKLQVQPTIEELDAGTSVIVSSKDGLNSDAVTTWVFNLYYLEAQPGSYERD